MDDNNFNNLEEVMDVTEDVVENYNNRLSAGAIALIVTGSIGVAYATYRLAKWAIAKRKDKNMKEHEALVADKNEAVEADVIEEL